MPMQPETVSRALEVLTENRRRAWLWGILALLLGWIYWPVAMATFGIYDANKYLLDYGWTGESSFSRIMNGGGRWVYAFACEVIFPRLLYISDLGLLRLLSFGGLLGGVYLWVVWARRHGWAAGWIFAAALLLFANPAVAVYIFWSVCFPYPAAIALALGAALLWSRQRWLSCLLGALLLQVSFAIYQPAALTFVLGGLLMTLHHSDDLTWQRILRHPGVFNLLGIVGSLGLNFALFKGYNAVFLDGKGEGERLETGLNFVEQAERVVTQLVPRILDFWNDLLTGDGGVWLMVALSLGLLAALVAQLWRRPFLSVIVRLVVICAAILLAFLPALVSAKGYAPYRLLAPAYAVFGLLAVAGWREMAGWLRPPAARWMLAGLLAVVMGGYTFMARATIKEGIVVPRQLEYDRLMAYFEALDQFPEGLTLIPPDPQYPAAPGVRARAEYGVFDLTYEVFSDSLVALIALEAFKKQPADIGHDHPLNRMDIMPFPRSVLLVPPVYPILDATEVVLGESPAPIQTSEPVQQEHPRVGVATYYAPHYYSSPWFGNFWEQGKVWARHESYGWIFWTSPPGSPVLRFQTLDGRQIELTVPAE